MAATFGVTNITDLTAPVGGFINEASVDSSIDTATVQDEGGDVVVVVAKKLVTITQSIKGKGDPGLSAVTAGGFSADTVKVIEAKGSESNEDFPDFEITGRVYSSLA